ncbi:hypothetical protein FRB93_009566 [Tulasnella sp. JGI-2019a]|nr:hypothetical protein FRB93_009566 [Tulasnella sp. JGI-2019a]
MSPEAFAVELPQLQHLSMRVHPLMTEHLLQRIRIPSCKTFDVEDSGATGPTLAAGMEHPIPCLSSILLAASKLNIHIGSTALRYEATAKVDRGDEREHGEFIHILASSGLFSGNTDNSFALGTVSWLLNNVHSPSFSQPVFLDIHQIASSAPVTPIIERLSSVITKLKLGRIDASLVKTILSYLAEPFEVIVDGTTTLRWLLPNLTNLSFEQCDDLEPEVILACIHRRTGRGLPLEGRCEHREELPAMLTSPRLPFGYSTIALMRIFPDLMEWSGLEPDDTGDLYGCAFIDTDE